MMKIVELVFSVPYSIVYNFLMFPVKIAIKCPVLFSINTKIAEIHKGNLELHTDKIKFGMIKIGFAGTDGVFEECKKSYLQIAYQSKLIFYGNAFLAKGATVRINGGRVTIGNNFWANRKMLISSHTSIDIGEDFLAGWGCTIQDSSNHKMFCDGTPKNETKKIVIGNHVWFGSEVVCLKGTSIQNDSVVAMRTILSKKYDESNVLLGGIPARIIQHNVTWKK